MDAQRLKPINLPTWINSYHLKMTFTLLDLLTDDTLDHALQWCRQQRHDWPVHDAVWTISLQWNQEKPRLRGSLLTGNYRFEPVKVVKSDLGKVSWIWHARDAIVLKAITTALQPRIDHALSKQCTHLKGHGSIPRTIQSAADASKVYPLVFKSDVKGFYESINHDILLRQLEALCPCPLFMKLIRDFLEHTEEYGGLYNTLTQGISKSCPLSPLLGAIYLTPLDKAMEALPVKYIRFMDDWIVFAKTRWHLRKAIKITNQILADLKLLKHPDKTWIGRVAKTFDFCGFRFSPESVVALAKATQEKFTSTICKLYEQGQDGKVEVEKYIGHFNSWVNGCVRRGIGARRRREWGDSVCRSFLNPSLGPSKPKQPRHPV